MNKNNRVVRAAITVLLAGLMAGSSTAVLLTALGIPCGALPAYGFAFLAAVLCGAGTFSAWSAGISAVLLAGLTAGAVLTDSAGREGLKAFFVSLTDASAGAAEMAQAGGLLTLLTAAVLGIILFWMMNRPGRTAFGLLIYFAILICSYALSETMSFGRAVPGLIAALAAFALSGGIPKDLGAWRAAISAALIVALALLMVPAGRLTWAPLENAARTVRNAFEDYFRFTEERIPFTISTEGYNHAVEENGAVVARLGGPAVPHTEPVMKVRTNQNVLLRGAIRRTYTGHSWTDDSAKARYLYYDFTRGAIREKLFGMHDNEAFAPADISVEFLKEGTSALFVPARMDSFSMDLENAVYYNSVGEMFLSRPVQAGDAYAVAGRTAADRNVLREAVIAAQTAEDDRFNEAWETAMQLPDTIEAGVYSLTVELTQDFQNPYDKVAAIEHWLRTNCAYTLTPDYPQAERDFVSQFIMDSREGYCSYFATAMTVMCRIAGVPARYAEGYFARTSGGEARVLTGEDAHAWTEVYFNGLGWVAFDPSNGGLGGSDGRSDQGMDDGDTADDEPVQEKEADAAAPTPTPSAPPEGESGEPSPSPSAPPEDESGEPSPPPSLPPEDESGEPSPSPSLPPEQDEAAPPPPPKDGQNPPEEAPNRTWRIGLILLILLLILLLAWWIYRRLARTNPLKLAAACAPDQAAMILYRSVLTLLAQTGQSPLSGETPGAFARRVVQQMPNPDFVAFADGVAAGVYGQRPMGTELTAIGRRAYESFAKSLKFTERLRFVSVRLFRGLGNFENIP